MNTNQAIDKVADLMANYIGIPAGTYTLFVRDKTIGLSPRKFVNPQWCVIRDISPMEMTDGFTPQGWSNLEGQLRTLCDGGVI